MLSQCLVIGVVDADSVFLGGNQKDEKKKMNKLESQEILSEFSGIYHRTTELTLNMDCD